MSHTLTDPQTSCQARSGIPNTDKIKARLEEVRLVLLAEPGSFSLGTLGPALEDISSSLLALHQALEANPKPLAAEDRQAVSEVLALSGRVGALYHQALALYTPQSS